MKSLSILVVIGLFLFVASAGVSWLFIFQPTGEPEEDAAVTDVEDMHTFPPRIAESDKVEEMPVPQRPETPLSIEAVTELAQSIMKKEKAIYEAEQRLKKQEHNVKLLFEDVRSERDELASFVAKVEAKIVEAREATKLLQLERQSLDSQVGALTKLEKKTGKSMEDAEDEEMAKRVRKVKDTFSNLEEAAAAAFLKELANRGDTEFAARILFSLEDRDTAKILSVMESDATFVAELFEVVTQRKRGAAAETLNR